MLFFFPPLKKLLKRLGTESSNMRECSEAQQKKKAQGSKFKYRFTAPLKYQPNALSPALGTGL